MNEENKNQETPETKNETKKIVGVQFSSAGKVHLFASGDHELGMHELVVVEGDKGPIIGKITLPPYDKHTNEVATNIRQVIRKANEEDVEKKLQNREEAMRSFKICQDKILEHNLLMKLVDVNILTGDTKAIFYFTAEERVDFRALVKDLATALHMRIEMRQIGARDASKCIGGLGSCGLICCCVKYLREFRSIAIQMAKNQGLSPNPAKLTGMCGKLKCCLFYENDMYTKFKRPMPNIGSEVDTPNGKGVVSNLDVPRQLIYTYFAETNKEIRFPLSETKILKKKELKKKSKKGKQDAQKK